MNAHQDGEQDWKRVELQAQLAEAGQIHSPPVPVPSQAQQLLWVTTRAAELQARLTRKNGAISEAIMFLSIGATERAQQALNRGLLDL